MVLEFGSVMLIRYWENLAELHEVRLIGFMRDDVALFHYLGIITYMRLTFVSLILCPSLFTALSQLHIFPCV